MPQDIPALHQRLAALTAQQPYAVHWQLRTLDPGTHAGGPGIIGEAAQTQLASFSTRKVSLLLACLALVHRGDLHLGQRFAVTAQMKDGVQAGIMKDLAPGVELSLEDHLRQMMTTSDNICTQLVFEAIDQVTGDALQWVNDYCSWTGMRATVHREIFPRSADLDWHHSVEGMTVTSPGDQAHLLALLGAGTHDADSASRLHLTPELCRFATNLMRHICTPLLGAGTAQLEFAEKNGRGLRSLSQVGLALTPAGSPVAAVAVFAENVPAQLPDGTPGRLAAYDLFDAVGQLIEDWHLDRTSRTGGGYDSPRPRAEAAAAPPMAYAAATFRGDAMVSQQTNAPAVPHALAGTGKLFAALALAERAEQQANLLQLPVRITDVHRSQAAVGPLRTHTGDLTLSLGDALGLVVGTSDAAASLAVRDLLHRQQVDLVGQVQRLLADLAGAGEELSDTAITGLEDPEQASGDLVVGHTTPQDLLRLLTLLARAGGLEGTHTQTHTALSAAAAERVLGWMAQVFEPAGLTWALPGYGPKKVPQWSVSGAQLRSPSSSSTSHPGWASVMITHAAQPEEGLVAVAAHQPAPPDAAAAGGHRVSRSFGALGAAARRGAALP